MSSVDVFCRNVKTILTQRNVRIKDLAERVGLSESYLSLFLSGSRKNLKDEYKDRIAASLNMTLSQLYSEDFGTTLLAAGPIFVEDPDRTETVRLVETFLSTTHLDGARPAFHSVLAGLSDHDARTVRAFMSGIMAELLKGGGTSDKSLSDVISLPDQERSLLAVYSIAGNDARLEWVEAASGLRPDTFRDLTGRLTANGFICLKEDVSGQRSTVRAEGVPLPAILTSMRIRDVHLAVAGAMQTFSDQGPYFEEQLAEHFIKAGSTRQALEHLEQAARLMESSGLWREAAGTWHRASILYGILDDTRGRGNCLAEVAKCLCIAGEFKEANEFGSYACRFMEDVGEPRALANVCIMMGNMLREHDTNASVEWYRRGIKSVPPEVEHGRLLVNLASALLEASRLDEAENTLKETMRWAAGRDAAEVGWINLKVSLSLGLIEYQRRNWKRARTHFESCVGQAQAPGAPLDTAWHNLGMLMYRDDNMKMAREYLVKAQDLYWERGEKLPWAYAAIELAKVALRAGDPEEARRQLRSAEPYLEEKSLHEKGWVLLIQGCIDREQRHLNQAIDNGRKAVDIFQREGAERDLACAALWLSSLYGEAGDLQQATFLERRAFQIYDKRHWDVRELHRERSLLEPAQGYNAEG